MDNNGGLNSSDKSLKSLMVRQDLMPDVYTGNGRNGNQAAGSRVVFRLLRTDLKCSLRIVVSSGLKTRGNR